MSVFINRPLNMKKIKAIGFDMDYTLVRYKTENFEQFTYEVVKEKLVEIKNYPKEVSKLKFDFHKVIQGLVIDKKRGNILKLSRFGKVKTAFHGSRQIDFKIMQKVYQQRVIDLNDPNHQSLDTSFSVSNGVLFAQLVDLKEKGLPLPNFEVIADDIKEMVDLAHRDGTLKNEVRQNIDKYIIQDPEIAQFLERYKKYGKKLLVITNSDYGYTRLLMDHTITPYLKEHKSWTDLFDITVTLAHKPRFFTETPDFLKVDPKTGSMTNFVGPMSNGIYQGGCAAKLQKDLNLEGDEILYLGDHIYGDVVSLKKTFNWRTALVLDPLSDEIKGVRLSRKSQDNIEKKMELKEKYELQLNQLYTQEHEETKKVDKDKVNSLFKEIEVLNGEISEIIKDYQKHFNPHWGEMMRAGQEESRFADQVEKYACIYMSKISDLLGYSPRTYFRPIQRILPHEQL